MMDPFYYDSILKAIGAAEADLVSKNYRANEDYEPTVFAVLPWTPESKAAVVQMQPGKDAADEDFGLAPGYEYFLEVHIIAELLEDLSWDEYKSTYLRTRRIIEYAINDA